MWLFVSQNVNFTGSTLGTPTHVLKLPKWWIEIPELESPTNILFWDPVEDTTCPPPVEVWSKLWVFWKVLLSSHHLILCHILHIQAFTICSNSPNIFRVTLLQKSHTKTFYVPVFENTEMMEICLRTCVTTHLCLRKFFILWNNYLVMSERCSLFIRFSDPDWLKDRLLLQKLEL